MLQLTCVTPLTIFQQKHSSQCLAKMEEWISHIQAGSFCSRTTEYTSVVQILITGTILKNKKQRNKEGYLNLIIYHTV